VSPDGQLWEVPTFPCPVVVLGVEHAEIDGCRVPPGEGADGQHDPRAAATAVLVATARRLRGQQGAIRATVRAADSDVVWQAIVTGNGELFDATPAPGTARPRWGGWRLIAAGAGVVVVLAVATVVVVASNRTPPPAVAAAAPPPPTGTPTPYPSLPPPGYGGQADWSAPIAAGSVPVLAADGRIVTVTGTAGSPTVAVLDPATGVPVWSAELPRAAATFSSGGGLHLSRIDGHPVVAVAAGDTVHWWTLDGEHTAGSVAIPERGVGVLRRTVPVGE